MYLLIFLSVAAALAAGYAVKWYLDYSNSEHEITWNEYFIGAAAIVVFIAPLVGWIGWDISKVSVLTYHENWNGWELAAVRQEIQCERDGDCRYDYDCDPYTVHETCTREDSNGHSEEYDCSHTEYHHCPYVTSETNYIVKTTLGPYDISLHRFPEHPEAHRWSEGWGSSADSLPDYVVEEAGTGVPAFWQHARDRIAAGVPGPVTARRDYKNYILASDQTILKQYSSDIARFDAEHLLPPLAVDVRDFYLADKVHFVGLAPRNAAAWQNSLNRINAALGSELQGDLHVVIVKDARVDQDKDSYALALKAYWQDVKTFGKDALSKNGIVVIVGTTDGKTVSWSRAFTGMPLGNEQMAVALENGLTGLPLQPDRVLGTVATSTKGMDDPDAEVSRIVTKTTHTGAIASIIWGDSNPALRFTRISMGGDGDKTGHGSGFLYLNAEIGPTTGQTIWIAVIVFFLSCCVWFGEAVATTRFQNWGGGPSDYRADSDDDSSSSSPSKKRGRRT